MIVHLWLHSIALYSTSVETALPSIPTMLVLLISFGELFIDFSKRALPSLPCYASERHTLFMQTVTSIIEPHFQDWQEIPESLSLLMSNTSSTPRSEATWYLSSEHLLFTSKVPSKQPSPSALSQMR